MAYSNAAIFVSEFITTMFAIYMAESVVATELLPETKGRSMVGVISMYLIMYNILATSGGETLSL